jgi:phospholipase C
MPAEITKIQTIIVVMMENRSFDHMLGYLSLGKSGRKNVEGLKSGAAWNQRVASHHEGRSFLPWHSKDPFGQLAADPPHERTDIAKQLGVPTKGTYSMDGFVANYAAVAPVASTDRPAVMSYFTADEVPIADFFARNFAVCDHWFSSLPAGTQPNRLMAMSGTSRIDVNTHLLPNQHLVYDWLTEHQITWRVYHEGMPFFAMMPRWIPAILDTNHFRGFAELGPDILKAAPGEMPQVIFIEPGYTDAPHIGRSSDDHAPSGASAGQEFLMKVYNSISLDPILWSQSVMIITYDEHGGFFDHVSPMPLVTVPPAGVTYEPFETAGVRVPSFLVSPFVKPGSVFNGVLDHTSILKFLGERFGQKGRYSSDVDQRKVASVLDALDLNRESDDPPAAPELNDYVARGHKAVGFTPGTRPYNEIARSFQTALDLMHAHSIPATVEQFADLEPFVTRAV